MKTRKIVFLAACSMLILNLIWEFSHHTLYIDLSGIPKYTHLLIASLSDMLILLGMFGIVSLKNRTWNWITHPRRFDYAFIIFLGLSIAVIIEVINLNAGRWEYTPAMPTILNIGVSPLVQLAATGIISLFIIQYCILNSKKLTQ